MSAVGLLAWLLVSPCHAADGLCDADLVADAFSFTSYQMREDRCEGAHALKVSSSSKLIFASFTGHFDFDPRRRALTVRWPTAYEPAASEPTAPESAALVQLRARSLGAIGRGIYYRMDSSAPAASTSFRWPTDVVAALGLETPDVGMVAWTRRMVADMGLQDIYLPVDVLPEDSPAADEERAAYRALVVPAERLQELYVEITDANGVLVVPSRAAGIGYYPAGTACAVEVPKPPRPGLYRLQLTAEFYRDPSVIAASQLWFQHGDVRGGNQP